MFVVLNELCGLLNTDIDKPTLSILIRLCELGVNPHALAQVLNDLRNAKPVTDTETHGRPNERVEK